MITNNKQKALFIVGNFLPHKNAGIENYTFWWIKNLGVEIDAEILIINSENLLQNYNFEGINVKIIKTLVDFKKIQLKNYLFVHFMELSGKKGINSEFFAHAAIFTKVFFTFHLPYSACIKGDLRFLGSSNCTSKSILKCSRCIINSNLKFSTKLNRIVNYKSNNQEIKKIIRYSEQVFYYADWFYNFLKESKFDIAKFKKVPYLNQNEITHVKASRPKPNNKIVFVGRIEREKGLDLICKALANVDIQIEIDVFGNIVDDSYFNMCQSLVKINYKGTISRVALEESLINYDLLVLPSNFSEMASMVLYQAILQQIPVLVSSSHGNLELVKNYHNSLVFDYGSSQSLKEKLHEFYANYSNYNHTSQFVIQESWDIKLAREYRLHQLLK
jgi:glycosyltransferase involved in cell wall biosynthesis